MSNITLHVQAYLIQCLLIISWQGTFWCITFFSRWDPDTSCSYLQLSPCHVGRLLGVERIGDASHHKDIELQLLLSFIFFPLQFLHVLLFWLADGRRARAGWSRAGATAGGLEPIGALAGPAGGDANGSGLRSHHLSAFLLHYPVRFLFAGGWIQHFFCSQAALALTVQAN